MGTYGTVGITICSYNDTNHIAVPTLFNGHSYIIVENNRSWTLNLGYYELPPFSQCTIGLWGGNGLSDSSSSESGSGNNNYKGVYFNREAYILTRDGEDAERTEDCVRYYVEVEQGLFSSRMRYGDNNIHFLIAKADTYNLATYNCSIFAADFFERATGLDIGLCSNPQFLEDSIKAFDGHFFSNDNFSKDSFFKYSSEGELYVYD
jgi:hypothetical protein